MLKRGIRIGVGTDSSASVSPLDLLAEVREARELAGLTADQALALVTTSAASALGLESEIGSLSPGKRADFAVFDLAGAVDAGRLADTLLARGRAAARLTVIGGREVFQDSRPTTDD
jgi:5-methylthioadenosine/S-adenosylhomocysteine deaminase